MSDVSDVFDRKRAVATVRRSRREETEQGEAAADLSAQLVEHIQSLRRYALALSRSSADADDLVQETLKRALQYLDGGRSIDNLRAYLFTMLHNVRRDGLIRQARAGVHVDIEEGDLVDASEPTDRIACHETLRAIRRLPTNQRQVVVLVGVEGASYREAAELLEVPIGTVMSRLNRARVALRAALRLDERV